MKKIPTFEECIDICNKTNSLYFYYNQFTIDGYDIYTFNYRLANYSHFEEYDAFELRGLTFVFDNGILFKRYLGLHKFFNVNENESTQYIALKDKQIKSVELKHDGSLIYFIKLPCGRIIPKTKGDFNNIQTEIALKVYNSNEKLKNIINESFDYQIQLYFELVSPFNQVVVKYYEDELILIKARHNDTGKYCDISNFDVKKTTTFDYNLEELIELCKTQTDIEGYVVLFEDDTIVKNKTLDYFSKHHTLEFKNREDYIIDMILKCTIDDFISVVHKDDFITLELISKCQKAIDNFMYIKIKEIDELLEKFTCRKDFALQYRKDKNFDFVIKVINGKDKNDVLVEYILKNMYFLSKAREFVDEYYNMKNE
jgi:RNA ligase